jgi:hypothetical protein
VSKTTLSAEVEAALKQALIRNKTFLLGLGYDSPDGRSIIGVPEAAIDTHNEIVAAFDSLTDALTKTNRVLVAQRVYAEECEREITTVEARIEAALALADVGAEGEKRGERVGPKFAECIAAILRGERDEG